MTLRIRNLAQVNPGTAAFDALPSSSELTFMPLETVWADARLDTSRVTVKGDVSSGYVRFQDGDVIVPKTAPTFQHVRTTVVDGLVNGLGAGSSELHLLRPRPDVDARFLAYVMRSSTFIAYGVASYQGVAGLQRVPADTVADWPVSPFSQEDQRQIADFLDDQVAKLDVAIDAQRRQRVLLLERFRSELAAQTLLTADSPGAQRTRVKYLFESERNGIWGADPVGNADDIPCLRVADFDRERFTATTAPTIRSVPRAQRLPRMLRRGDVLLEKSGGTNDKPVGCAVSYLSDEPAVCSNFVAALRPAAGVVPRFAGLLLAAMYQTRRNGPFVNQTTGIQNLDSNAYLSQEIWLPNYGTQEEIVDSVEQANEHAEQLMSLAASRIRLLEERRQALITAAVTGQFDVTTARAVA